MTLLPKEMFQIFSLKIKMTLNSAPFLYNPSQKIVIKVYSERSLLLLQTLSETSLPAMFSLLNI